MEVKIYFDGACDNARAAIMGIGVAVVINNQREEDYDIAANKGHGTSNRAEYLAIISAYNVAKVLHEKYGNKIESIKIFGDSQLIINQVTGLWRCKQDLLQPLLKKAIDARGAVGRRCQLGWLRREFNTEADKLSKAGLLKNKK